ncbi:MAG: histidine kinase [Bacteroidota bacterium]
MLYLVFYSVLGALFVTTDTEVEVPGYLLFIDYLFKTISGFLITHVYRLFIKSKNWIRLGILRLSIRVLLSSLILSFVWTMLALPISLSLLSLQNDFVIWISTWANLGVIILAWSLIYYVFQLFLNFKQSEVEKWKLEAAVKNAELLALKSQINPHFIFNSLNNIRSLVIENPERSRDMITHLSGLLRYSIQFNNFEKVRLEEELEIVQNYLNLESIQFEDRLQYKLEIKPETLSLQIPPMVIQLLVENAIKHGIANLPEGGLINIKSAVIDNALVVEVINTGQLGSSNEESTGIGLKNASERLKLLFGRLSNLKIQNLDDKYVSARFTIPLN